MANVGYATLQIIPSAQGFSAALMSQTAAPMAGAGQQSGKAYGSAFGGSLTKMAGIAAGAFAAIGIAGVVKDSVGLEASFSKTMATMGAVAGVPAKGIKELSDLALKMGADTTFSAGEAGDAMLELAKGGISAADIKAGALKGTMTLAAAGTVDLGTAATIASNAMNTFGLKGKDMGSIAAALAGGANASSASVESLGQALSQVGPGAAQAGISLQTTVGILSAFDAVGIKGSDAGTSLKTMLTRLVPSTKGAATAMKELGLKFTDAHGNFVPMTNVAEQLKAKMGPLSDATRTQAMNTIFGADATRAATALMNLGADGVKKYTAAASDQSAATKAANAAMSGTAGALEGLSGSFETVELKAGQFLAPAVQAAAAFGTDMLNKLGPVIDGLPAKLSSAAAAIEGFLKRNGDTLKIVAGVITAVYLPAMIRATTMTVLGWVRSAAAAVASSAVQAAKLALLGFRWLALGPTAVGVAALTVGAWVRQAAAATVSAATQAAALVRQGAAWVASGARAAAGAAAQAAAWLASKAQAAGAVAVTIGQLVLQGAAWAASAARSVAAGAVIAGAWLASKAQALGAVAVTVGALIAQGIAWAAGAAAAMASAVVMAAAWLISLGPIALVVAAVIGLAVLIALNFDRIKGWISAAWEFIKAATAATWSAIKGVLDAVIGAIVSFVTAQFNTAKAIVSAVWNAISSATSSVWNAIKSVVNAVVGWLVGYVTGQFNLARTIITTVWTAIQTASAAVWNAIKAVVNTVIAWLVGFATAQFNTVKSVVTTAWNLIKTGAETAWNAIKSLVTTAINAIKTALSSIGAVISSVIAFFGNLRAGIVAKLNEALAFVRSIPGKIKAGFGNIGGMLLSVGSDIVQGLVNGISGAAGRVMGAVRNLVSGIPAAAKSLLGIGSPSKVMAEIGRFTSAGLVMGLTGGLKDVNAAAAKMVDLIRKAGVKGASSIIKNVEADTNRLRGLATQREIIVKKIEAAQDRLAGLREESAKFAADIAGKVRDSFDLISTEEGGDSVAAITARLQGALAAAKQFAADIATLRARGLNDQMLRDIAEAGPEAGAATAAALAKSTAAELAKLNTLSGDLGKVANSTGKAVADELFSAGIKAAQGLANGLLSQKAQVEAAMLSIAVGMKDAIKKALGIHSPSAVMADLGVLTAQGFALGIASGEAQVQSAMARLVVPPAPPALTATAAGPRGPAATSTRTGPLIGTAVIHRDVDIDLVTKKLDFAMTGATFGGERR